MKVKQSENKRGVDCVAREIDTAHNEFYKGSIQKSPTLHGDIVRARGHSRSPVFLFLESIIGVKSVDLVWSNKNTSLFVRISTDIKRVCNML